MEMKDRINEYWSSRSKEFSYARRLDLTDEQHEIWLKVLKDNLPNKNNIRALDLGTGAGFFAFLLDELGIEVVGIDYSQEMIDEANINKKELGKDKITFKRMDAMNLEFEDESFDFIITRNVTWTLPDPKKAYEEMVRVLKPNGRLLNFDANYGKAFKKMNDEDIHKAYENQTNSKYKKVLQSEEQMKERNNFATSLYIADKNRPSWDLDVLLELGMRYVSADISDCNDIFTGHDTKEKHRSGMFKITAIK